MTEYRVLRDLNKLNTFVRVAERKSFTRAAQDLRTTPSVISKHIKELEDGLGFVVLNRSTHGVSMTEYGEGLLQHCLQMLDQVDHFVTDARMSQKLPHGTLRLQTVGHYADVVAAPVVTRFLRRMPTLKLHHIGAYDSSQMVDDGADVILSTRRMTLPGFHEVDLGPVAYVVCASPEYLKAKGCPVDPRSLKEHNCIADLKSPSKEWPFMVHGQSVLIDVSGTLLSNGHISACRAALDGLGVIRAPALLVEAELRDGRLISLLQGAVSSSEHLIAYYSNAKALPKKTTEFLADLRSLSQ